MRISLTLDKVQRVDYFGAEYVSIFLISFHNRGWWTLLVYFCNGVLTWVGKGFGITKLTIELILGYILYPLTFFMGVPRSEIFRVSQLLATKLVANEFVAYSMLSEIRKSNNPLSLRADLITQYALCGFANIASLGIQIGVLSSLGPARGKSIARLAPSAMLCGFLSTMQAAGIAYVHFLYFLIIYWPIYLKWNAVVRNAIIRTNMGRALCGFWFQ